MRKLMLALSLAVLALPMLACMTVNTTVNEDGSGLWEMGLNMSALETLGATEEDMTSTLPGGEEMFTDPESGVSLLSETREIDGEQWIFFAAAVPDLEGWEALNGLLNESGSDITASAGLGEDTTATEEGETADTGLVPTVTISDGLIRVEYPNTASTEEDPTASDDSLTSPESMAFFQMMGLAEIKIVYNITLPGEITDAGEGEIDAETNTVTYTFDMSSDPNAGPVYAEATIK
jgi:hypothetical protein